MNKARLGLSGASKNELSHVKSRVAGISLAISFAQAGARDGKGT